METYKYPPAIINAYVWNEFTVNSPNFVAQYNGVVPIFPVRDALGDESTWGSKPYIVYDNMARFRTARFYGIRKEQLLYSIRGDVPQIFTVRDLIVDVLDRADDTAKDVNFYSGQNLNNPLIFFHDFRVYQMSETSEKTDNISNRQYYATELIIEYQYHQQSIYNEERDVITF